MRRSIEIKLIVIIGIVLFVVLGIFAFLNTDYQRRQLTEHAQDDAVAISNTIEKALEQSMHRPKKQGLQQTINDLAEMEEVKEIRIINSKGIIKFSNKKEEIDQIVEEKHRKTLSSQKTISQLETEKGVDVYCLDKPILNQKSCHPCHGPKQKVLGRLDVDLSLATIEGIIVSSRNMTWLLTLASFLIISLIILLFTSKLINNPIKKLICLMSKAEKGNLDVHVDVKREDELGSLGRSFNIMVKKIKNLQQSNIEKAKALSKVETELKYKDEIEELNKELQKRLFDTEKANQQCNNLYVELEETNTKLDQRVKELTILHEVSKNISSILDLEQLLKLIMEKSTDLFQAQKGSLMLVDKERKELAIKVAKGLSDKIIEGVRLKYGEKIAGLVLEEGEPLLVENIEKDPKVRRKKKAHYKTKSFISLPLIAQGKEIGVINISDKITGEIFNRADLRFLSTLESQASIAIRNAQLFQEVESLSITDELTDLHNRRYIQEELKHEIERCKRFNRPLSILVADIDWFKNYNDRYGHPEGDKILKQVSNILKEKSRAIDIVSRYGGEEFLLVLPETNKKDAVLLAERLREAVEKSQFKKESTQPNGKLTISLGLATYPIDAPSIDALIKKADQALYRAKRKNRNQVCS